jgi:hypothetical protein
METSTATLTEEGFVCNTCQQEIFAGCELYFGEWLCRDCDEWTYPFYYEIEDGCQHCGSKNIILAQ